MSNESEQNFAVFAEADGQPKPLILTQISFARLMDDIIVPYQADEPFFIDGAPLKRQAIKKLKIIKQTPGFHELIDDFHHKMRSSQIAIQTLYGEQYQIRLEALLRESGDDVTSQIIKAHDKSIGRSLKEYLPKRDELIQTALSIFVESMKALSKG